MSEFARALLILKSLQHCFARNMKPLVFLLLFIGARSAASQNPEVNTTSGMIIGVTLPESHAFYGVRYAKPPIGELR